MSVNYELLAQPHAKLCLFNVQKSDASIRPLSPNLVAIMRFLLGVTYDVHRNTIYWTNTGSFTGSVVRLSLSSGEPVLLHSSGNQPRCGLHWPATLLDRIQFCTVDSTAVLCVIDK